MYQDEEVNDGSARTRLTTLMVGGGRLCDEVMCWSSAAEAVYILLSYDSAFDVYSRPPMSHFNQTSPNRVPCVEPWPCKHVCVCVFQQSADNLLPPVEDDSVVLCSLIS